MSGAPPSYHRTTMSPSVLIAVSWELVLEWVAMLLTDEIVVDESMPRAMPASSVRYTMPFCSCTLQKSYMFFS